MINDYQNKLKFEGEKNMTEIKAPRVKRPIRLSSLAEHLNIRFTVCLDFLQRLTDEQEIFRHDLKRTKGGDYTLSAFAVTKLFLELESYLDYPDRIIKLGEFMKQYNLENDKSKHPGVYLLHSITLKLHLESDRLREEIKKNDAIINGRKAQIIYLKEVAPCGRC